MGPEASRVEGLYCRSRVSVFEVLGLGVRCVCVCACLCVSVRGISHAFVVFDHDRQSASGFLY